MHTRQTQLKAAIDREQYDRAHQLSGKIKEVMAREIDELAQQVSCWVHRHQRLSHYNASSLPALLPRTPLLPFSMFLRRQLLRGIC